MGSFKGHALPGSLFITFGLWWMFHAILENASSLKEHGKHRNSNARSWRRFPCKRLSKIPFEPLCKVLCCLAGIIAELTPVHFHLVGKNNQFLSPNKFAHSTMYGFFAFSGIIEVLNLYEVTQFSREAEYTVLALAFGAEGTLFSFHLHGRDMFDVRIHTLLYIVIYLAALVILLEACLPKFRRELFMARAILVLTQGTWFLEIAHTIYGPHKWFENAKMNLTEKDTKMNLTEKDTKMNLTEKELMLDTEVVTVSIMWHLLGWSTLVLFCCIVTSCLYKRDKLPVCCSSYGKAENYEKSFLNGMLLRTENDASLSDEEEILLKCAENNNPQSDRLSNNIDEEAAF